MAKNIEKMQVVKSGLMTREELKALKEQIKAKKRAEKEAEKNAVKHIKTADELTEEDFRKVLEASAKKGEDATLRIDMEAELTNVEYRFCKKYGKECAKKYLEWRDDNEDEDEDVKLSPLAQIVSNIKTAEDYSNVLTEFSALMKPLKEKFNKAEAKVEAKTEQSKKKDKPAPAPKAKSEKKEAKSERIPNEFGKMFGGVPQVMKMTASVRKECAIAKYSERCYTLKTPKSLHDFLSEFKLSWNSKDECYWLPQSKKDKVAKKLGIKIA